MTPTSAVRSFAITLAIAITIVGPRASGFTIHRNTSTLTTPSTDLSSDESLRLQVRDDLKKPNDISSKNEESNRTKSNKTKTVVEKVSQIPEMKTEQKLSPAPTTAIVMTTTENVKIPTISSDTVEVFDSIEDTKFYNKTETTTDDSKKPIKLKKSDLELTEKPIKDIQMETKTTIKTEPPTTPFTTMDNTVTKLDDAKDHSTQNIEASSGLGNKLTTPVYLYSMTTPMETETTDIIISTPKEDTTITTDLPQIISNVSTIPIDDIHLPTAPVKSIDDVRISTVSANSDTEEIQTTTDNINTNITEPFSGKYPKYTTIIRKGTTSSEETTAATKTENEEMDAETSNTQVNFEKAFNITPIPSLEKLRTNLLSNINTLTISDGVPRESEKVTREVELSTQYTDTSTEPQSQGKVESKRAGFLDNSEKATTPILASVSKEIKENVTQEFGTADIKAATETVSPDLKKVSGSESQSQLAEDELQEEFLKEEVLNNHNENAIRYHEDRTGNKVMKLDKASVAPGTGTEDSLSVQPIERTKTTLYAVSPSYKPMKKIDVQPAKLFVRDPDDNSWRNESISSLGIVFKPKNSSKSFKEVLKNKTQTELNSLVEQTKDDVPDLRVRLEKIAEGRKKKKMNKFGEVVYTDYEENSAEINSTSKPEQTFSALNSAEAAKVLTTYDSQPGLPTKVKIELTTPMTATKNLEEEKEKPTNSQTLDLFSRLGLDPLTTLKPKKYFNIAEYYDTTDEYDADYVTMMKLDLKKFTPATRTTRPLPPSTRPVEPHIPERRPTVQYFPPREPPPPVNLNNIDREFERKINLFSFKEYPRIEPRPLFVTIAPLPIATAKPDPAEVKPLQPLRPLIVRPDVRLPLRPGKRPGAPFPPADAYESYVTSAPPSTESEAFLLDSGRLDRGSYVIKHYKDFLAAAGDADYPPERGTAPPRDAPGAEPERHTYRPREDDEYFDTKLRKDVLNRFVDNFNRNSERFKIDFPILYNSSAAARPRPAAATPPPRPACAPPCAPTVELSPAYELHYYVPEQEERQEPGPYRSAL